MTTSPYTVCRRSWMTDTLVPRAHSYRITARTSVGDHVVSTRLSAIVSGTLIPAGTPVCCDSLFYGAVRLRHASSADATSVVEPATGGDSSGVCLVPLVNTPLLPYIDETYFRDTPRIIFFIIRFYNVLPFTFSGNPRLHFQFNFHSPFLSICP